MVGFALLAFTVGLTLDAQMSGPILVPTLFRSGDTNALTIGADVAYGCLQRGVFRSCGLPSPAVTLGNASVPTSRVERFALLLYIPAVASRAVGMSRAASLRVIGVLNAVGFVFLVSLPWLVRRRLQGLYRQRFVWAVVVLCGPLLPYAASTWSECLAAALVAATVAGVATGWPPLAVVLLAFFAAVSKETMAPFIVLLAVAVAAEQTFQSVRSTLRTLGPVVVGCSVGAVANAAFNIFRFGSTRNLTYLAPALRVTQPGHVALQTAAVLVSPNGGVAEYWPTLIVPFALAVVTARHGARHTRIRLGLVALTFLGFCSTLGTWYSPFGWHAWGPRLILPIVPAAVLAVCVVSNERVPWPSTAWTFLAVSIALSVPNVAVLTAQDRVTRFMTAPVRCRQGSSERDDPFVSCVTRQAWHSPWVDARVLVGLGDPRTAALGILDVGVGLIFVGRAARRPRRSRAPSPFAEQLCG
jgi:hypothetical protein